MKNLAPNGEERKRNPSTESLKQNDLETRKKASKMTKDIYAVKYVKSGKVINTGFEKKQDAKLKRNELCKKVHEKWEKDKQGMKPFPYIVVKGKEHPLYRD